MGEFFDWGHLADHIVDGYLFSKGFVHVVVATEDRQSNQVSLQNREDINQLVSEDWSGYYQHGKTTYFFLRNEEDAMIIKLAIS